jgi:hypothetical protein
MDLNTQRETDKKRTWWLIIQYQKLEAVW